MSTQGEGLSPGYAHQSGGSSPGVTVWGVFLRGGGVNLQGGILRAPTLRYAAGLYVLACACSAPGCNSSIVLATRQRAEMRARTDADLVVVKAACLSLGQIRDVTGIRTP